MVEKIIELAKENLSIDGEITAKEFQDWIDSTKVRKKII